MSNMLSNAGFWVAIALPLSGLAMLISSRLAHKMRLRLFENLLAIMERPGINAADVAIVETIMAAYRSRRGWVAIPLAPLAALALIPFGVYRLIVKGPQYVFDWATSLEDRSFAVEVAHLTQIDAKKATIWDTKERKELWSAASNSMRYQTPLSQIWLGIWIVPSLLLLVFVMLIFGYRPQGARNALRFIIRRTSDVETAMQA